MKTLLITLLALMAIGSNAFAGETMSNKGQICDQKNEASLFDTTAYDRDVATDDGQEGRN